MNEQATESLFAAEQWRVDSAVAMAEGALNGTEPKRGIWDDRDYLCAILAVLTGDGDRARAAILGAGEDSRSSLPTATDGPERRRVRMDLSDGAYMGACVSPDASPETLAALRAIGEAAAKRMRDEADLDESLGNEDDAALRNYLAKPKGIDE